MKDQILKENKKTILNVYHKDFLKNCSYEYVAVIKDLEEDECVDGVYYTNYQRFFEQFELLYPIPPIRKVHKLLTYQQGIDILNKVNYGALCIQNEFPYCMSLNHFVVDGHVYFHTGYKGFKLKGLNQLACYHVVEDLGIHKEASTHNHQSVIIYGYLKEVKENKKALLNALMERYAPGVSKDLDQLVDITMILELTIEHMSVKRHFH